MIAIIDYGAGNIFSVKNALDYLGLESQLTSDKDFIKSADEIILPGVGAFPSAMKMLEISGLIDTIKSEINKYLKEHDAVIYGTEDLSHATFYQGSVEIIVMITCNGKTFSVAEFKDFVTGSLE